MKKVVASLVFSSLCMSSSDVFAESALKSVNGLRGMIGSKVKNLKKVCVNSSDVFAESALRSVNGLRSTIESKIKNLKKVCVNSSDVFAESALKSVNGLRSMIESKIKNLKKVCMSSSDVFAESALRSVNGLRSTIESKIKNLKKVSAHFKKGYAAQKKSRRKKRVSTRKVPTKRELIRFVQKVGSKVSTAVKKPEVQLALLGTSAAVAGSAAAAAYSSTNFVEALITKFGSSKIAADPIAANSTSAASAAADSISAVAADPGFWARSLSTVKTHPWISTAIVTGICAIPTITLAIKAFNKKGPINAEFEEGLGDNAFNSEGEKVTPVTENLQNQEQIEINNILQDYQDLDKQINQVLDDIKSGKTIGNSIIEDLEKQVTEVNKKISESRNANSPEADSNNSNISSSIKILENKLSFIKKSSPILKELYEITQSFNDDNLDANAYGKLENNLENLKKDASAIFDCIDFNNILVDSGDFKIYGCIDFNNISVDGEPLSCIIDSALDDAESASVTAYCKILDKQINQVLDNMKSRKTIDDLVIKDLEKQVTEVNKKISESRNANSSEADSNSSNISSSIKILENKLSFIKEFSPILKITQSLNADNPDDNAYEKLDEDLRRLRTVVLGIYNREDFNNILVDGKPVSSIINSAINDAESANVTALGNIKSSALDDTESEKQSNEADDNPNPEGEKVTPVTENLQNQEQIEINDILKSEETNVNKDEQIREQIENILKDPSTSNEEKEQALKTLKEKYNVVDSAWRYLLSLANTEITKRNDQPNRNGLNTLPVTPTKARESNSENPQANKQKEDLPETTQNNPSSNGDKPLPRSLSYTTLNNPSLNKDKRRTRSLSESDVTPLPRIYPRSFNLNKQTSTLGNGNNINSLVNNSDDGSKNDLSGSTTEINNIDESTYGSFTDRELYALNPEIIFTNNLSLGEMSQQPKDNNRTGSLSETEIIDVKNTQAITNEQKSQAITNEQELKKEDTITPDCPTTPPSRLINNDIKNLQQNPPKTTTQNNSSSNENKPHLRSPSETTQDVSDDKKNKSRSRLKKILSKVKGKHLKSKSETTQDTSSKKRNGLKGVFKASHLKDALLYIPDLTRPFSVFYLNPNGNNINDKHRRSLSEPISETRKNTVEYY